MRARSYLLDTHVVLWLDTEPKRFRPEVTRELADADALYYSAASAWETAIKHASGKIMLAAPFTEVARQLNLIEIAVTAAHGEGAASLPRHHNDPFDRLLVAQSMMEDLVLVTADPLLKRYEVKTLLV